MTAPVQKRPVRTELVEDPRFLGAVFQSVENAYRDADYEGVLTAALPDLAQDHAGYFARAADSAGSPWAPLSPVTVQRKKSSVILVEKGDLRRSLTAVGAPENLAAASHRGLIFGTSDEKAGFHQAGTSRMPARPPVGITTERVDALANSVADSLVEQLKG